MIILKIKDPGFLIEIPGIKPCRSPVDIDITKLNMRVVLSFLKSSSIINYQIVSEEESFKPVRAVKKRVASNVVTNPKIETSNENINLEQINDKLDNLERLLSKTNHGKLIEKEPEVEEIDAFIPNVDTSKMKIKSKSLKIIKQDSEEVNDSVDVLSSLIKGK